MLICRRRATASTPRAPKVLRAQGEKLHPALPQTVSYRAVFRFSAALMHDVTSVGEWCWDGAGECMTVTSTANLPVDPMPSKRSAGRSCCSDWVPSGAV